jgi:hypothetical protein
MDEGLLSSPGFATILTMVALFMVAAATIIIA